MSRSSPGAAAIDEVLRSLRRGQRNLARNRATVEAAVRQLLLVGPSALAPGASSHAYRIDDLARASGVTVRNIRAYQERGLLHPPVRRGRVALFDESHLARLSTITSMLNRGYTFDHISEMLAAWQSGSDLAHVLGVESALVSADRSLGADEPRIVSRATAVEAAGSEESLQALIEAGLAEESGARIKLLRPHLIKAFAEMRGYGMSTKQMLNIHKAVVLEIDKVTEILVSAGAGQVAHMFAVGDATTTGDVEDLVALLRRFRTLAMRSVTATLSDSIDRTVEGLLADYLAQLIDARNGGDRAGASGS